MYEAPGESQRKKSCLFGIVATVLLTSKNVSFFLTNENNRLYNYIISIYIFTVCVFVNVYSV